MEEKIKSGYHLIGEFFISMLTGPLTAIAGGFVLMKLWIWFLVPMGLFNISLVQAIGIKLIVTFLTLHALKTEDNKRSEFEKVILIIIYDAVVLLFGFIYSRFL